MKVRNYTEWNVYNKVELTLESPKTLTRYTHAHQVPQAEHMESSKMAKFEVLARRRRAVLCLSVHESASEIAQVVTHKSFLVTVFLSHPFVEQLTIFHTSGLVLASSSMFRALHLDLHAIT